MKLTLEKAKWNDAEHKSFDVIIRDEDDEFLDGDQFPFTFQVAPMANESQVTAYVREVYDAGEIEVAEYEEPAPSVRDEIAELERYLTRTDWYAIRYAETGEEIPAEILAARGAARIKISELRDNS